MENRFLDVSAVSVKRRKCREAKRDHRQRHRKRKPPQKHKPMKARNSNRSRRRARRLPCCGKERRYCNCSDHVAEMINDAAMTQFITGIAQRDILHPIDAKDMAFIIPKLNNARTSIQNFMFRAAMFRMYSKPSTYEALSPYVNASMRGDRAPDFQRMEKALAKLYAAKAPVWGGMFYPATLKVVMFRNGKVKHFHKISTPTQKANRDIQVFKTIWSALVKDDTLQSYYESRVALTKDSAYQPVMAARESFAAWYDSFYSHLKRHTKGWFGDYAMKCLLDVGCAVTLQKIQDKRAVFPNEVLSKWPIGCPAYAKGVKKLMKPAYKGKTLNKGLKRNLLMHVHSVVSKKIGGNPPLSLPATLAHLCWEKRS